MARAIFQPTVHDSGLYHCPVVGNNPSSVERPRRTRPAGDGADLPEPIALLCALIRLTPSGRRPAKSVDKAWALGYSQSLLDFKQRPCNSPVTDSKRNSNE